MGATICTGDPSVDPDPKCLTQEELDLLIAGVATETGVNPNPTNPVPEVAVPFADVHPVLVTSCSGGVCHGGGLANPDLKTAYNTIVDKNLCQNIWYQVKFGKMPAFKGCTGDPAQDSLIEGCLDETSYNLLKDWVNGEVPCAP